MDPCKDDNRKDFLSKELEFWYEKKILENKGNGGDSSSSIWIMKNEMFILEEEGDFNNKANGYYSRIQLNL